MKGNDVKKVQSKLNEKISSGLSVDGSFGQGTETSVRTFQQRNSLSIDGVVGQNTWNKLMETSSGGGNENINNLLVFSTFSTKKHDKDGVFADDLKYGDYSKEKILKIHKLFEGDFYHTEKELFYLWELMALKIFSVGDLEPVVIDVIKHFKEGSGSDYRNKILTNHVADHKSTKDFIEPIKAKLIELLKKSKGNLKALEYDRNNLSELANYVQKNLTPPVFNDFSDIFAGGLTFLIHDTWSNKVEVTNYSVQGNTFKGNIHYTIYDHFGLDRNDVDASKPYVILQGFRAWFMLQRYDGFNKKYKPFCTVMEIDIPFEGQF